MSPEERPETSDERRDDRTVPEEAILERMHRSDSREPAVGISGTRMTSMDPLRDEKAKERRRH